MAADFAETRKILADPTSADATMALTNIESWIAAVQPLGETGRVITSDLEALKDALTAGDTNVAPILARLGTATTAAANGNSDLEALGAQLSKAGA